MVLRSDNEPALAKVVEKAIKVLKNADGVTASWEGSVPYDPQTNGHAEGAVRLVKGMFRVLLLGMEKQICGRLPLDHPAVAWLISHAAHVRNLRVLGADGKTPFQRARGTCSVPALLGFGELCRYKKRANEKGIASSGSNWSTGIWLGIDSRTGQYILFDKDGRNQVRPHDYGHASVAAVVYGPAARGG